MVTHRTHSEADSADLIAFLNTNKIGPNRIVSIVSTGSTFDVFYVDA